MKLLVHSQTSTGQPLKFGNRCAISSLILFGMWSYIPAGIKVNSVSEGAHEPLLTGVKNRQVWFCNYSFSRIFHLMEYDEFRWNFPNIDIDLSSQSQQNDRNCPHCIKSRLSVALAKQHPMHVACQHCQYSRMTAHGLIEKSSLNKNGCQWWIMY